VSGPKVLAYGDPAVGGWFRLIPGAGAFEPLGGLQSEVFASGNGVWAVDQGGAGFYTQVAIPDTTLNFDGSLVGADDAALYTNVPDPTTGVDALWRDPISGGSPALIAQATTIHTSAGDRELSYFDNDPLLLGSGWAVKLWTIPAPSDASLSALVIQPTRLP